MPGYDDTRFAPPAPVALVSVRSPDGNQSAMNVPMLIDSGADVTLLPDAVVATLGLIGTGERYQLVAFDGSTSESESVSADLLFLGRRFRGRFLLTESEVGILGRDVLNHLRLLFDGPALSWSQLALASK
jgi:hypothetical protein